MSALLFLLAGETAAQDEAPPSQIVLWSSQGPVAVERAAGMWTSDVGPTRAERLLRELIEGPTPQETAVGLWTAIPSGTALLGVLDEIGDTLIVRLDVPPQALQNLDHESFEILMSQIDTTLKGFDWRDLRVQVRDPETDAFVALAQFLPPVPVSFKPPVSLQADTPSDGRSASQPPAPGQAQPVGALSGKTVYVSAGHGWQWVYSYSAGTERWETQRPPYPSSPSYDGPIIEDHNNAEAVNQYLLHYLWNAGAMVWTVRERDMNPNQVVVDDTAGSGFMSSGWALQSGGYGGHRHETETVSGASTAAASWSKPVPADGRYAVYVWYRSGSDADRVADARYTVHHAGGDTTVVVDQRFHGRTWHYIGTYGFLAGEEARVTLTNLSSEAGKTVVADAVRFGGGTFDDLDGIDTGADRPPFKPWWEVASFYYTQRMGMDAAYGDVTARPIYARWEHAGTGDDAVYVSWHTNGYNGLFSGTETYAHNGEGLPRTEGSLRLRQAIHTEVVRDIRAGWDASWIDRGEKQRNLGELRLLWDDDVSRRMPGALIEIGFHDHPGDTDALKHPAFNQLVARAVYQGIAKYFDDRAILLPEPPTHLAVENIGASSVRVSWQSPPTDGRDLGGGPATGYRVYTSTNGIGWSNGVPVSDGTEVVLDGFSVGRLLFVRVTATNGGGESFPTETLAARIGDDAEVLLVNGFDRLNETMVIHEDDPVEGPNARMLLDRMNRYDYVLQHGQAIDGYGFDSASNEAVQDGSVDLSHYAVVDWILGEESAPDETLSANERARLQGFLESGGALLISGTEIGWHLDNQGADPWFHKYLLRADFVADDAGTYWVAPASGSLFDGLGAFRFDADGMYDADFPDVLAPINGAKEALVYQGGTGGAAAIQYVNQQNGCERVVYFGFPFETIEPQLRSSVMSEVMGFLGACLNPTVDTSIDTPTYGAACAGIPTFEGSATVQSGALSGVDVQIQDRDNDTYWDGSTWVALATWLEAEGRERWSYSLPLSLSDGEYQLRARARTTTGDYDESPAETVFIYDATPPSSTALIAPTGGATISALPQLELVWEAVEPDGGSSLSYRIDLDDRRFPTTHAFYTATHIAEGIHRWGVQVADAAGNTSAWVTDHFVVDREWVGLPLVVRHAEGEPPSCSDLIINGGFESDAAWMFNGVAGYDTEIVRSGNRSARAGILPHEPAAGLDDVNWSSARQVVALPSGSQLTLRLWVYPILEANDKDDLHYISVRDQLNILHHLELTTSDANQWRQGEYDLSEYAGQTITIYVGVQYDSDDHTPAVYIDDVELEVCP